MTASWDENEDSRRLAGMLSETPVAWSEEDLAAMLRQQLGSSLADELVPGGWMDAATLGRLAEPVGIVTFRDVFTRPGGRELLEAVKEYAKDVREDSQLTAPIRRVLYFAVLAVARVRLGAEISRLGEGDVAGGFRWCLEQPWLESEMRAIIAIGLESLPGQTGLL